MYSIIATCKYLHYIIALTHLNLFNILETRKQFHFLSIYKTHNWEDRKDRFFLYFVFPKSEQQTLHSLMSPPKNSQDLTQKRGQGKKGTYGLQDQCFCQANTFTGGLTALDYICMGCTCCQIRIFPPIYFNIHKNTYICLVRSCMGTM